VRLVLVLALALVVVLAVVLVVVATVLVVVGAPDSFKILPRIIIPSEIKGLKFRYTTAIPAEISRTTMRCSGWKIIPTLLVTLPLLASFPYTRPPSLMHRLTLSLARSLAALTGRERVAEFRERGKEGRKASSSWKRRGNAEQSREREKRRSSARIVPSRTATQTNKRTYEAAEAGAALEDEPHGFFRV
jgi:hypothetical protein